MSFAKAADAVGFDEQRNVLVLSVNQSTNIYPPNFSGQPISVRAADPAIATVVSDPQLTPE